MTREEIIMQLKANHEAFIQTIASLNQQQFEYAKNGKWNAGQTLDHLYRAVSTLAMAMRLPWQLFSFLFGKANRASRSYDELVAKYRSKLEAGGKAHGRYIPANVSFEHQKKAEKALVKSVDAICRKLKSCSEKQLDSYILPHPLLGKVTFREMMYFTIYHAEHHRGIILRDLSS